MNINIAYPLAALHEASKYIWENNPVVTQWPDAPTSVFEVMDGMLALMKNDVKKNASIIIKEKKLGVDLSSSWIGFTGTGGYYFIYDLINSDDKDITISLSILVDPAIGVPDKGYVTETIDKIEC